MRYLTGVGYAGHIYPVNPSYQEVDGITCFPTLTAIGAPIDVVVLALPAALIADELENCAAAGAKFAIVLSAGFVEAGAEGADLQRQLQDIAKRTGVRVIGPNCQGFYNIPGRITTTFSPTVAPAAGGAYTPVSQRRVGIIAQSGGIGFSLFARGRAAGLGFSYIVSSGNEADLTTSDLLDYMVHDDRTDVIVLFCETVRDPQGFVTGLAEAQRRGKPVIALKVGTSPAAQRAAASHTAALTGWDTGYRAVFERYNVIQAEHPDDAIAIAGVFATCPLPKGRRAGIITVSGGGGALMADMLAAQGLAIPELSPVLQTRIASYIPAHGSTLNPVDLTLNSAELVMPTIELLEQSDEVDMIVLVSQLASGEIMPLDAQLTRTIVDRQAKPVATWTYTLPSPAGLKLANDSGLFMHLDLRNCARGVGKLTDYAERNGHFQTALAAQDPGTAAHAASGESGTLEMRQVLSEHRTRQVLAGFGLPAPEDELALNAAHAQEIATRLGYPVVLKVQSPDIPHKTEAGGVRLNLADAAAVRAAHAAILAAAQAYRPDAHIEGVLVQRMAPKGHELVIGMVNDATFGPIMMMGLGGIGIELFGDVVHCPAPLSADEARTALNTLKSSALFHGYRGAPAIDLAPVAQLIAQISQIAHALRVHIAEMEFNPVIVHADGSGVTLADALMILKPGINAAQLAPTSAHPARPQTQPSI